jgi:predicted dehydrogenase
VPAVRPARVALIGCGNISRAYVAGCSSLAAVELVACTDADPARAAALAAEAGFEARPLEAILADPSIEVVVNLTPPAHHVAVSLAAIEAGKHVYSEKPLATSLGDARAILEAAAARGVRLGCAPDTFLGGGLQTARDVLDAGAIGEPLGAHAAVLHLGPERWHPDPEIFFAHGGGPLLDVGPYYVAALVNLLGPVESVEAFGRGHRAERVIGAGPRAGTRFAAAVPTYVVATYRFASGAIGSFLASFDVVASTAPHLEVHGTAGSLGMGDPNTFEGEVMLQRAGEEAWNEVPVRPDHRTGRGIGLAELVEAIGEDRPHRASGEFAYHVLDVLLATEAAAEGRPHQISSTSDRPASLVPGTPAVSA